MNQAEWYEENQAWRLRFQVERTTYEALVASTGPNGPWQALIVAQTQDREDLTSHSFGSLQEGRLWCKSQLLAMMVRG